MNRIFVDTGAWFARFVPSDRDHAAASEWFEQNTHPLVTTDYIIDELLTVLRIRNEFQRALELGGPLLNGDLCDLEWVTDADVRSLAGVQRLPRQAMELHRLRQPRGDGATWHHDRCSRSTSISVSSGRSLSCPDSCRSSSGLPGFRICVRAERGARITMPIKVDGHATPKIIDVGVAKATEIKLTDQSLVDSGAIVGTPAYMSPEQADPSSMDIDTRTDIYALGVILYELVAGSPPIDAKQFRRGAVLEMLRMVREIDPPRPSTKLSTAEALPSIAASRDTEPELLKRALRGDLDWIVMKALEKDRTRRDETANGFAADVLRR